MRGIYIDSSYRDDDEEDVDTDYSEGDEVDADDLNANDGILSDMGLLFLLRLQLGLIHDDKRDDEEGDDEAEDMSVFHELFQEHDDDDDEGEDIDMYEEINTLFYEPDYMDEVVHRNIVYVENMINLAFEYKRMHGIYIDSSYLDDDEEDVDTDYSKGDEVDADDSNVDDGTPSDVGLLFLLRLQLVVARDDKEGDDDVKDMYEGLFELFQELDDDDNEGEDIDMYEELNMSNLLAL
nr:hypothetical protein [Tanacetum cinerariifolium]